MSTDSALPEPKKKKKKKRAVVPAPPEAEQPLRAALDVKGRPRAPFLLRFPQDPELESLIAAFEVGNYARVRAAAPRLIASSERAEVRAAAQELLTRLEPDPLAKYLLLVAVLLFVLVVAVVYRSRS